jgi:hypothetical protein
LLSFHHLIFLVITMSTPPTNQSTLPLLSLPVPVVAANTIGSRVTRGRLAQELRAASLPSLPDSVHEQNDSIVDVNSAASDIYPSDDIQPPLSLSSSSTLAATQQLLAAELAQVEVNAKEIADLQRLTATRLLLQEQHVVLTAARTEAASLSILSSVAASTPPSSTPLRPSRPPLVLYIPSATGFRKL